MKLINALLLVILTSSLLQAQTNSILNIVPKKNLVFLMDIAPNDIYKKLDKEAQEKLNVASNLAAILSKSTKDSLKSAQQKEKLTALFENPANTGLETQKEVFIWGELAENPRAKIFKYTEKPMYFNTVLKVTDKTKLEALLVELYGKEALDAAVKVGAAKNMIQRKMLINWNDKRVVFSYSTVTATYYEKPDTFAARLQTILEMQSLSLGKEVSFETSILSDKVFKKHLKMESDMSFWMDYNKFGGELPLYSIPHKIRETVINFYELFTEMKIGAYINVNKEELSLDYTTYVGKDLAKIMKAAYNIKANRNLYKYVKGDNLLALYTMRVNIKGYWETFSNLASSQLVKTKEGLLFNDMWEIVDIFLDEDEIYSLWSGDIMMALTDIKPIERERTTYKYNSEKDTWDDVIIKRKELMPIGVMGGSFKSEENVMKFINLGVHSGALAAKGDGVYTIPNAYKETGVEFFIIINKGVLLITNDVDLATKRKGFAGAEKLPVAEWKNIAVHPFYAFVDIQKIGNILATFENEDGELKWKELADYTAIYERMELKVMPVTTGEEIDVKIRMIFAEKDGKSFNKMVESMEEMGKSFLNIGNEETEEEFDDFDDFDRL